MKHVAILIPRGHTSLVNIEGTHQILTQVNMMLEQMGRPPVFDVKLVGLSRETRQTNGLFTVNPDVLLQDGVRSDLIFIPAVHGEPRAVLEMNREYVPWILQQYENGAQIVSFCVGSFFLAATGLLNGRKCTTHWMFANEFRRLFPEARLLDDKIMTEEDGIFTSGGAYSYLNLLLYLIERFAGRQVAIFIAKAFAIEIDRESQSAFIMFKGQKDHDDDRIMQAQEFIEQNYQERITVEQLAARVALSRRNLERRFKKATSNTVVEYWQRVKIEAAKKNLETGRRSINEVMHTVGYSDTKSFRTIFKKITGLSPIEYRNKYNRELAS